MTKGRQRKCSDIDKHACKHLNHPSHSMKSTPLPSVVGDRKPPSADEKLNDTDHGTLLYYIQKVRRYCSVFNSISGAFL